jgi:hypothetical protein
VLWGTQRLLFVFSGAGHPQTHLFTLKTHCGHVNVKKSFSKTLHLVDPHEHPYPENLIQVAICRNIPLENDFLGLVEAVKRT